MVVNKMFVDIYYDDLYMFLAMAVLPVLFNVNTHSFACISVLYSICLPFLTCQVIVSRLFFFYQILVVIYYVKLPV